MNTSSSSLWERARRHSGLLLALGLIWFGWPDRAAAQSEEGVKAAFLYNFAKFAEWPASAFASASTPITVGFVGGTELADTFDQNVKGKNVNGRDFVVKKLSGAAGVEQCQIVYVAEAGQVSAVTAALKGKATLIIGETDNLLTSGGMIRFAKAGAKIVFDLDLATTTAAGLKVDAKLQKVARTVKGG